MILIDKSKCVGCGQCVEDCVARNLEIIDKKVNVKGACLQCGHCVSVCANNAVSIPEFDMDDVEKVNSENKIDSKVLLSCIKARRSIRDFKDDKLSEKDMKLLGEAGRYTATANNGQFHKYIFIQDELDKLKDMVWDYIDALQPDDKERLKDYDTYKAFLNRKKIDAFDDFLFRNAPTVLFITSQRYLDAGLAAQNIEMMAYSLGMGVLYNGFLVRIADDNSELKKWLDIDNETICVCMLLGFPKKKYHYTAPRKKAEMIIK